MISVIMGVHAINHFLPKAINSILTQEFKDFEFIIVANGNHYQEVYNYLVENYSFDKKVVILKSPIGQLAHALNVAIDHAKGDYIARMDSDDISAPQRLGCQLDFLLNNKLDMVGANIRLIDEQGVELGIRDMPRALRIKKLLPFKNCFAHNTILIRRDILIEVRGYNSGFNSEDYDLWLRLRRKNIRWDNMDMPLLDYRIHSGATQRRLLGYAECSGYALREFILNKSLENFLAIFIHIAKSIFRSDKRKSIE